MNIFGGYSRVEYDGAAVATVFPIATPGVGGVQVGFADLDIMEIGANLIWTPVKQLDIGVEAVYRKFETKGNVANAFAGGMFGPGGAFIAASSLVGSGVGDDDVIEARLRIQRDF